MFTRVKNSDELKLMRESGRILAETLQFLKSKTIEGISTKEIANLARTQLKKSDASSPILGYQGFPDVICISINDEVVHGIPSVDKIIQDGDIVSLDFCVNYRGMITDSAISFIVGKPKNTSHIKLIEHTETALETGIAVVHDGIRTGDIGSAIEGYLNKFKYGIVRDLVGHGVGDAVHEDPNIPNYGRKGSGSKLHRGMTIAIEPMVTLGAERVYMGSDGWTVYTWDGSWAAHFEHTIAITADGAEVLTRL